ncbi:DUF3987 domain-containing protein [Pseudomaricurvus alkylphenolicus]|uniref:YfjI family protein n=1 Tax=Pseudomaricurvus alkylphenolicus TaxID=1306991 RepID=UPI00141E4DC3|nr:YfjI family protein [Pseudomaricurvus alkylphenolicus]NIB45130.1 DUF3987 domain-containing protein [Pseudomaricurvus alkylphenolicus]
MTDTKVMLDRTIASVHSPIPLDAQLPPVLPLSKAMLPPSLEGFVFDVAGRAQCPADYVAVSCIVILSAILGNKYSILPKQHDNWEVRANLWGAIVGPPSAMKSPAMKEAAHPLIDIEKSGAEFAQNAIEEHQMLAELHKLEEKARKQEAKALLNEGRKDEALEKLRTAQPEEQHFDQFRYIVNDASVEKLGELLNENPNGLLLMRDELSGFLAKLSQEDGQLERAFYLECFDGNSRFTYDRIGRGTIVIDNCTLSLLGGIQPSKIARLISMAMRGRADDGLVQRLQLTVWPDPNEKWEWLDRRPDQDAYQRYRDTVRAFHQLPLPEAGPIQLKFSDGAQSMFADWMTSLRKDIADGEHHPVVQSHLAKSPKAVAALALLFELVEGGKSHVGQAAVERALLWAQYLRSHALRLYSINTNNAVDNAKRIVQRRDKLTASFTARDVRRKGWAGLTESSDVNGALECLVDHYHLLELPPSTSALGGRPTVQYRWHPELNKIG